MLTINTQGSFISDGNSRVILIPSGYNHIRVTNQTNIELQTADSGIHFEWFTDMAPNDSLTEYWDAVGGVATLWGRARATAPIAPLTVTTGGFSLISSPNQTLQVQGTVTGCTAAANPVVTTTAINIPNGQYGTTHMITNRTVVRMTYTTAIIGTAPSIMGIDYTVTVNSGTTFTLPVHATALPNCGAATFSIVSYDYNPMFYPQNRTVINITRAAQAIVTTSVIPGYTPGQSIRMIVPDVCGMKELNNKIVNVVYDFATAPAALGLTVNDFVIDYDTTSFTAFTWPLAINYRYQVAEAIPVGQVCGLTPVPGSLAYYDATTNVGYYGVVLSNGGVAGDVPLSPAGSNGDVMRWQASKVENL